MAMIMEERWIKHYSSYHKILLVGEGDFSFSLCLALAFQSAANIVATSLDSYDELVMKYSCARYNLENLYMLGATLFCGVDATKMSSYPDLQRRKFHRIVYNFPHAGFLQKEDHPDLIKLHSNLVHGFFKNARLMLYLDGEVHVAHKITDPFNKWGIVELAESCSLQLVACDNFRIQDFPGYCNKRGSGFRCDEPFPLGPCSTFKFRIALPVAQQLPLPIHTSPPSHPFTFNNRYMPNGITSHTNIKNECQRIFGGYLKHVEDTFGDFSSINDVIHSVRNALSHGFQSYVSSSPTRPLSDYIEVLEELHLKSVLRREQLRQLLSGLD